MLGRDLNYIKAVLLRNPGLPDSSRLLGSAI